MKLLTEVAETEEFYRLRSLLESNGIVLHVCNEDTARNFGVFHPVGRYAIYILFEDQFEDAKALTIDPNHNVRNLMDVEQFMKLKERDQQKVSMQMLMYLSSVLFLMVIAIVLFVFLTK